MSSTTTTRRALLLFTFFALSALLLAPSSCAANINRASSQERSLRGAFDTSVTSGESTTVHQSATGVAATNTPIVADGEAAGHSNPNDGNDDKERRTLLKE